jgi:hypothetical protein
MPNGFLVCKNVPIARTGTQEYQGLELGITDRPDELFPVYREESEVFDPAALASFEGVPLVDEHPKDDVTVDNAAYLMRGFVKDVRRGDSDDADKMIADIIITDPLVIAEIENGKREISCGYKCDYDEDSDGRIRQRNIRGNHVALVYRGRAGQDVAIKDSDPANAPSETNKMSKIERRAMFMNTKPKDKSNGGGLLSKFFGILTSDADPAVVAELAECMMSSPGSEAPAGDETAAAPAASATAPADAPMAATGGEEPPAWAKSLIAEFAEIKSALFKPDLDPLDALEKELAVNAEEKVTKPVEQMKTDGADSDASLDMGDASDTADATDEGDALDAADAQDKAPTIAAKDAIAVAKKAIAGIKDPTTRRTVSDGMAGMIRQMYGVKPSTPQGSYASILKAKQEKAQDRAADAYPMFDSMDSRQAAYDARNPHIKKEVK